MIKEKDYKRSIEIYNELNGLKEALDEIEKYNDVRLIFEYWDNDSYSSSSWRSMDYALHSIKDILDKHKEMIINEINEKMQKLVNEIEIENDDKELEPINIPL